MQRSEILNSVRADKMYELVLNEEHLTLVMTRAIKLCHHRLFIASADVKDMHLPEGKGSDSIVQLFRSLSKRSVEIQLLHGGVPSGPFIEELKEGMPATLCMRRCPRMHAKAVIVDGTHMYLGSANLTGAGLGAKGPRRRNFEAGIWTDEVTLIDSVIDMLIGVWNGNHCRDCGRKPHCPVPLEEPLLNQ